VPLNKAIQKFRENINLFIYPAKNRVLNVLRILRLFVSSFMVGSLVYFYGYPQQEDFITTQIILIRSSFIFYIISFFIRFFYDFEPRKFLRKNWFEGSFMLILFLDLISYFFFNQPIFRLLFEGLATDSALEMFAVFTQFCLLLIVLIEFGRASQRLTYLKVNPSLLFIASFLLLILGGTGLLMMPEMTADGFGMSFLDAFFTATSASCVTGLIVVDTATYFSDKGIVLLMILIQLGGLNIISFASFFAAFSKKGVGLRHHTIIKDFMSYDSLSSTHSLLKRVVTLTLLIESLGAIFIFLTWDSRTPFESLGQKIFFSIFHSISAFNNAGFSTFTNGLFEPIVRDSYFLHVVIMILVFLGGIGIPILNDMFDPKNMRERLRYPWKRLQITSRLSLYTSAILIVLGAVVFYINEMMNPLQSAEGGLQTQGGLGQIVTSLFQSVIARTAGFNTTDISILSTPVLLFFLLLMFIGASSGGTGGGIKTSTFAVVFLSALATIRGKKLVEVYRHTISSELLYKAFSIFLFSLSVVFTGTFILSITDPQIPLIKLVFEEVSAFATVGLSTGITTELSTGGRIVIIASMFIGRVGVLTLAFALSKKVISTNYKYPNAYVMIG
jgi:Trk-type K+ transport system membrane component